jgi:hypothetical protein
MFHSVSLISALFAALHASAMVGVTPVIGRGQSLRAEAVRPISK